jgi:hypothetical protein
MEECRVGFADGQGWVELRHLEERETCKLRKEDEFRAEIEV